MEGKKKGKRKKERKKEKREEEREGDGKGRGCVWRTVLYITLVLFKNKRFL